MAICVRSLHGNPHEPRATFGRIDGIMHRHRGHGSSLGRFTPFPERKIVRKTAKGDESDEESLIAC